MFLIADIPFSWAGTQYETDTVHENYQFQMAINDCNWWLTRWKITLYHKLVVLFHMKTLTQLICIETHIHPISWHHLNQSRKFKELKSMLSYQVLFYFIIKSSRSVLPDAFLFNNVAKVLMPIMLRSAHIYHARIKYENIFLKLILRTYTTPYK